MNVLAVVNGVVRDFARFFWPAKHTQKVIRIGVVVLCVVVGSRFVISDTPELAKTTKKVPAVELTSPASVIAANSDAYVGTVRAISEANIQAEVAGRVTSVRVRPGDTVSASTILATLENNSQQAAVLQAEGAYEQAVAAAAISDVTVREAENALQQAINTVYDTATAARATFSDLQSDELDTLVADTDNVYRTGKALQPDESQRLQAIENAYAAQQQQLTALQTLLGTSPTRERARDLTEELQKLITTSEIITNTIRTFIEDGNIDNLYEPEEAAFFTVIAAVESQVATQRTALRAAVSQLDAAAEALARAQLSASTSDISIADAQVKSALGALRAAQAQLAKTILRTPISGTVNTIRVNEGDYVTAFTSIAEVANNGSLEVAFSVTEQDARTLYVGQTVRAAGVATGSIVSIAPAVDAQTQKTEVRAAFAENADLTNGSSVSIQPVATSSSARIQTPRVPLTAVRFTATDGFVFVVEDGALRKVPVALGPVRGSTVEILSGIAATTEIVRDARGLTADQTVTVISE